MNNKVKEQLHIKIDSRGQVYEVPGPEPRGPAAREDLQGREARLIKYLNWLSHNPTPGRPRQGARPAAFGPVPGVR